MSAIEITIFIMINLLCNPFGIMLHRLLARRAGPNLSYMACQIYLAILRPVTIKVVAGPVQTNLAYLFGLLFGISYGWYYLTISNGYYVSLVLEEKVSELWGLNSLCSCKCGGVSAFLHVVLTGYRQPPLRYGESDLLSLAFKRRADGVVDILLF